MSNNEQKEKEEVLWAPLALSSARPLSVSVYACVYAPRSHNCALETPSRRHFCRAALSLK